MKRAHQLFASVWLSAVACGGGAPPPPQPAKTVAPTVCAPVVAARAHTNDGELDRALSAVQSEAPAHAHCLREIRAARLELLLALDDVDEAKKLAR